MPTEAAQMGSPVQKDSRVVGVRVLKRDEHHYGVEIEYADDKHTAYPVGTRNLALTLTAAAMTGANSKAL